MLTAIPVFGAEKQFYQVAGISMEPTLYDGDVLQVACSEWHDGDIVVADVGRMKVVKRIIGNKLIGDNRAKSNDFNVLGSLHAS